MLLKKNPARSSTATLRHDVAKWLFHEQNLKVILEAYNRALFHFPFDHFPLEAEYHIWGALKKSPVFVPAHAASAVLQSDELLFHFSAASGADFIAFPHEANPP